MHKLKLYLIVRKDEVEYDEYDSAVVIAKSPENALELLKKLHIRPDNPYTNWKNFDVEVKEISLEEEEKVILESFNAG